MDNLKHYTMISVIVPVYNSERYLDKCIHSLLAQSYTDFEVLLIDDGSTDTSMQICERYRAKDERIKLYRKENGGVASARNYGIDRASGEWVAFVDSDDWVHKDFLKKRYECAVHKGADVVFCDSELIFKNSREYCQSAKLSAKKSNNVKSWMESRTTFSWLLLIRKSLIDSHNLRYIDGARFGEDFNFSTKIIMYAQKVEHICEALYFYNRINDNSAMHRLHIIRDDLQDIYRDLIVTFEACGKYKDYIKTISWCILEYKLVCILQKEHTYEELKDFYPESNRYILSNKFMSIKYRLYMMLLNINMKWSAEKLLIFLNRCKKIINLYL